MVPDPVGLLDCVENKVTLPVSKNIYYFHKLDRIEMFATENKNNWISLKWRHKNEVLKAN